MALRSEILLQSRPAQFRSPLESAQRGFSLREMVRQDQAGQTQMDQQQLQMAKAQQIDKAIEEAGGDIEKALPAIMQIDSAIGMGFTKHLQELKTSRQTASTQRSAQLENEAQIAKTNDEATRAKREAALKQLQFQAGMVKGVHEKFRPEIYGKLRGQAQEFGDIGINLPEQYGPDALPFLDQLSTMDMTSVQRAEEARKTAEAAKPKVEHYAPGTLVVRVGPDGQEISRETVPHKPDNPTFEEETWADWSKSNPGKSRADFTKWKAGLSQEVKPKRDNASLVQAVIANPALYDNLTPTAKTDIAPELARAGFEGFGTRLTEGAINKLSDARSAIASLRDLREILHDNEEYIGPLRGLQAAYPYSEGRKAQADIDRVKQRVGKALEGGVLRKEDEEKYKKILAQLTDEATTAIYKTDQMIEDLTRDLDIYIEEQRKAGRRVNGSSAQPAAGPRVGDTRQYQGSTYKFDGKEWVRE